MPFTPFHFGPGLLMKAVAPKRVSFLAFAGTQVCIDVETLYHLIRSDWPVHRQLHSLVGGSAVGLLVAAGVVVARPILNRAMRGVTAETAGLAAVIGGVVGGVSHSILDAIMHADVRPLSPFSDNHGLYGLLRPDLLEALCLLAGLVGLGWLWLKPSRWKPTI